MPTQPTFKAFLRKYLEKLSNQTEGKRHISHFKRYLMKFGHIYFQYILDKINKKDFICQEVKEHLID